MDKGSSHPFVCHEVVFATKHEKEVILSPLFAEIGLSLKVASVDTDKLGTFTGEVERVGTVRETLRAKINLALDEFPDSRLFLASEGSFLPHPAVGFLKSNLESLLLFDRFEKTEIYIEYLSTDVIHDEVEIQEGDDLGPFLQRNKFPSHSVIVRPVGLMNPIFKGVKSEGELKQAMDTCLKCSVEKKILVATDLRSFKNPTRRQAIYQAGRKLVEALRSFCPPCGYPGYRIVNGVPGLPCRDCGEPSQLSKWVVFECSRCFYSEDRSRPDGLLFIEAEDCEFCNP